MKKKNYVPRKMLNFNCVFLIRRHEYDREPSTSFEEATHRCGAEPVFALETKLTDWTKDASHWPLKFPSYPFSHRLPICYQCNPQLESYLSIYCSINV